LHRALGEPGDVNISVVAVDANQQGPATIEVNGRDDRVTLTASVAAAAGRRRIYHRRASVPRGELAKAIANHEVEAEA
jgi:hypothetical protein